MRIRPARYRGCNHHNPNQWRHRGITRAFRRKRQFAGMFERCRLNWCLYLARRSGICCQWDEARYLRFNEIRHSISCSATMGQLWLVVLGKANLKRGWLNLRWIRRRQDLLQPAARERLDGLCAATSEFSNLLE